jgi:PAS domain S-box-containing protein
VVFVIRVLHADDDRAFLELVKHFLEGSGDLVVDSAISGDVAESMLDLHTYDAIVSDYTMPGCNGIELLRYVRSKDHRIPFLFFSDQTNEEVVIAALTGGGDFFLPKGFQLRSQCIQLERAIRESVMRRRAEQEQVKVSSLLRIREAALQSSLCPIALCDAEGRIQYANPAGLAIWGYTDEKEVIGKYATDFIVSPETSPDAIGELFRERTWAGQATARRKDGSTFDARVYVSTLADDSGHPLGFVASFTDLSRQKDARARLESYVEDIRFVSEKANEMTDIPLGIDIFGFIADALTVLAPPGSIIIISSMHADATVRLEAARGDDASLKRIEQVIGRPLMGLTFHSNADGFGATLPGSVIEVDGGIDTITFGQLPPEICQKIQDLPFIGKVIGTGLSWRGQVYGVTAIILPLGVTAENIDVLDLFIRHCSAVLQRRQAEAMLRSATLISPE